MLTCLRGGIACCNTTGSWGNWYASRAVLGCLSRFLLGYGMTPTRSGPHRHVGLLIKGCHTLILAQRRLWDERRLSYREYHTKILCSHATFRRLGIRVI